MAKGPFRLRDIAGLAARIYTVWSSANEKDVKTDPQVTSGTGAPTGTANGGSVYLRKDGAAATTIYSYDTTTNSWTARS